MDRLSQILWHERELLETLSYKLEVERLVLSSGRTKWLVHTTREIEQLIDTMRQTEVLRAMAADEAAEELGLPPNPSLTALARASGEPWRGILLDHRAALIRVAREISETSEDTMGLLTAGYRAARETLLAFGDGSVEGRPPAGSAVTPPHSPLLVRSL